MICMPSQLIAEAARVGAGLAFLLLVAMVAAWRAERRSPK